MANIVTVVGSIYVDRQRAVAYPVRAVAESMRPVCDRIVVFGSDNAEVLALSEDLSDGVVDEIWPLGVHVREPADIARAQDQCVQALLRQAAATHILLVQADTWLTEPLQARLLQYIRDPREGGFGALHPPVDHVRCFLKGQRSAYGVTLFERWAAEHDDFRFAGDGAMLKRGHVVDLPCSAIDVGYYSPEVYARHILSHIEVWGATGHLPQFALLAGQTDLSAFTRAAVDRLCQYEFHGAPEVINPDAEPHRSILAALGLRESFTRWEPLLKQLLSERGAP